MPRVYANRPTRSSGLGTCDPYTSLILSRSFCTRCSQPAQTIPVSDFGARKGSKKTLGTNPERKAGALEREYSPLGRDAV